MLHALLVVLLPAVLHIPLVGFHALFLSLSFLGAGGMGDCVGGKMERLAGGYPSQGYELAESPHMHRNVATIGKFCHDKPEVSKLILSALPAS